jgi:hypothetical protein
MKLSSHLARAGLTARVMAVSIGAEECTREILEVMRTNQ